MDKANAEFTVNTVKKNLKPQTLNKFGLMFLFGKHAFNLKVTLTTFILQKILVSNK